jgi:hypothetical protein
MHDPEEVDELLNSSLSTNRTLRSIFDCSSHEWEQTSFEEKEALVMKLYCSDYSLKFYIESYKDLYRNDLANKACVAERLGKSIRMLVLNVKDELLRTALLKIYVNLGNEELEN